MTEYRGNSMAKFFSKVAEILLPKERRAMIPAIKQISNSRRIAAPTRRLIPTGVLMGTGMTLARNSVTVQTIGTIWPTNAPRMIKGNRKRTPPIPVVFRRPNLVFGLCTLIPASLRRFSFLIKSYSFNHVGCILP